MTGFNSFASSFSITLKHPIYDFIGSLEMHLSSQHVSGNGIRFAL